MSDKEMVGLLYSQLCPTCGEDLDPSRGDTTDRECHRCRSLVGCLGELDFSVRCYAANPEIEFIPTGLARRILGGLTRLYGAELSDVLLLEKCKRRLQDELGTDDANLVAKLSLTEVARRLKVLESTPKSTNEARDEWMHEKKVGGKTLKEIKSMLARRPEWDLIDTEQGIGRAINRYVSRHEQ